MKAAAGKSDIRRSKSVRSSCAPAMSCCCHRFCSVQATNEAFKPTHTYFRHVQGRYGLDMDGDTATSCTSLSDGHTFSPLP